MKNECEINNGLDYWLTLGHMRKVAVSKSCSHPYLSCRCHLESSSIRTVCCLPRTMMEFIPPSGSVSESFLIPRHNILSLMSQDYEWLSLTSMVSLTPFPHTTRNSPPDMLKRWPHVLPRQGNVTTKVTLNFDFTWLKNCVIASKAINNDWFSLLIAHDFEKCTLLVTTGIDLYTLLHLLSAAIFIAKM